VPFNHLDDDRAALKPLFAAASTAAAIPVLAVTPIIVADIHVADQTHPSFLMPLVREAHESANF
jgi:hypothetical protein